MSHHTPTESPNPIITNLGNDASSEKGNEAVKHFETVIHHNLDLMGSESRQSTFRGPTFLPDQQFSVELKPKFYEDGQLSHLAVHISQNTKETPGTAGYLYLNYGYAQDHTFDTDRAHAVATTVFAGDSDMECALRHFLQERIKLMEARLASYESDKDRGRELYVKHNSGDIRRWAKVLLLGGDRDDIYLSNAECKKVQDAVGTEAALAQPVGQEVIANITNARAEKSDAENVGKLIANKQALEQELQTLATGKLSLVPQVDKFEGLVYLNIEHGESDGAV